MLPSDLVIELAGHSKILGIVDGSDLAGRIETIKTGTAGIKRDVTVTPVFAAVTGRMHADSK